MISAVRPTPIKREKRKVLHYRRLWSLRDRNRSIQNACIMKQRIMEQRKRKRISSNNVIYINLSISWRVNGFDKTRTAEIICGLAIMLASRIMYVAYVRARFNPIIDSVYETLIRHESARYHRSLCTHDLYVYKDLTLHTQWNRRIYKYSTYFRIYHISDSPVKFLEREIFFAHEKNDFVEVSKNLARYKSENNFVWTIKIIK